MCTKSNLRMVIEKQDKSRDLPSPDYESLRKRVLDWVVSMQIDSTYFKMNENADYTIFTSCFALFIFDLFDQIKT